MGELAVFIRVLQHMAKQAACFLDAADYVQTEWGTLQECPTLV
jgi:hypothetical protein